VEKTLGEGGQKKDPTIPNITSHAILGTRGAPGRVYYNVAMSSTTLGRFHIAHELLARAHSPASAAALFKEKIQQKPLFLKPTTAEDQPDNARESRRRERAKKEEARRKSKKPRPLSAKQKRALCIYEIPESERKYAIYEPMHRMWVGYIREILGLDANAARGYGGYVIPKSAGPLLASADYHGALLEVVRSRCVSRVGLKGIVVKDTKFTFELITKRNELKIVPKEHTIFRFRIPLADETLTGEDGVEQGAMTADKQSNSLVFELHGTAFENRAPERATKRVKLHLPPDP